jgi:TolA-binding protein
MLGPTLHWSSKALAGLLALPLGACATTASPSREEVDGLRAEVAQLRARQVEQDRELLRFKAQLDDRGATAVASAPVAATSATRAEGASTTNTSGVTRGPQIPENLKVVYVAPEAVPMGEPQRAAREPATPRRRPAAAPAPLPTDTALREPVAPDASALSPEALEVAYRVALAAPNGPDALERFAREHPEAAQADNALFEAGLRSERAGQADRAAKDFERVVREHPAGDCVADALLHLAGCQLQLHKTDAARSTLARITTQFPGSAQAEAAQVRLTDLGG